RLRIESGDRSSASSVSAALMRKMRGLFRGLRRVLAIARPGARRAIHSVWVFHGGLREADFATGRMRYRPIRYPSGYGRPSDPGLVFPKKALHQTLNGA